MSTKLLPTQQELDNAIELIARAGRAGMVPTERPTPNLDRKMKAYYQQREKNKALAAECNEIHEEMYRQIFEILPEPHKELMQYYGIIAIAPYAINEHSYKLFEDVIKASKKILAAMIKKPKRRGE